LEEVCLVDESNSLQLIALSEALDQLEQEDRRKAELVKLRYFVGMSEEEAANALGISRATASRYWTYAKSWLHCALVDAADSKSEHK
jgi:RNA polymerase sigma factor (sigma-70 family)